MTVGELAILTARAFALAASERNARIRTGLLVSRPNPPFGVPRLPDCFCIVAMNRNSALMTLSNDATAKNI
jgi:hypothetical protein